MNKLFTGLLAAVLVSFGFAPLRAGDLDAVHHWRNDLWGQTNDKCSVTVKLLDAPSRMPEVGNMWFTARSKAGKRFNLGCLGESSLVDGDEGIILDAEDVDHDGYEVKFTTTKGKFYHAFSIDFGDEGAVNFIAEFDGGLLKPFAKIQLKQVFSSLDKKIVPWLEFTPNVPTRGSLRLSMTPAGVAHLKEVRKQDEKWAEDMRKQREQDQRDAEDAARQAQADADDAPPAKVTIAPPADSDYKTLELDPKKTYTHQDVKTAYRTLAKKWHPDKNRGTGQDAAAEKFKQVQAAFEVFELYLGSIGKD